MVLNSLNFCLSEKLFISPSILNEIFARYSNLGCRFSPFSTLNISSHFLLASRVSAERSAVKDMGFPLYVTCCFSLAAFNILSLCLVLLVWLVCVLACFSLGVSCMGLFVLLGLHWLFPFPCWGNFIISSKIFSNPFFFSSSGTPIILMLVHLNCLRGLWDYPQFFLFFLLYSALQKLFPPFYLPAHWFTLLLQIFGYWFLLEYF